MSVAPAPTHAQQPGAGVGSGAAPANGPAAPVREPSKAPIFDLSGIDLAGRQCSREQIARCNPHRGQMALLDWIVWHAADFKQGLALKHVRHDEFWVPGHFPERPMMPGVLQVECGAQLASYMFNVRFPEPRIAAFIKLDDCTFRNAVEPGDDFYLLAAEIKFSPTRFVSDIQGLVRGRVTFQARITGMAL